MELVLLVGRGLEASGWLNNSFWRAKTHGAHHAANSFTSKKLSLLSLMHIETEKWPCLRNFFCANLVVRVKSACTSSPTTAIAMSVRCWAANLARDSPDLRCMPMRTQVSQLSLRRGQTIGRAGAFVKLARGSSHDSSIDERSVGPSQPWLNHLTIFPRREPCVERRRIVLSKRFWLSVC